MLSYIIGNLGSIAVGTIVLACVAAALYSVIKARKAGGSASCGYSCSSCPKSAACHSEGPLEKKQKP